MPSKAYSDVMEKALSDSQYMEKLLIQNREKTGETAYKKTMKAIAELKRIFNVSEKMLMCIAYIFEQMQEVTPLALQKILYYIQGIYMAIYGFPLFEENCVAWQHGPVYEKVYYLFRDFKYNPIDDNRFALFTGKAGKLAEDEKQVIDLVVASFGRYSGKVLETVTHNERPWKSARNGYGINDASNVIMEKEDIRDYFNEVAHNFNINSVTGLNEYIESKLSGI